MWHKKLHKLGHWLLLQQKQLMSHMSHEQSISKIKQNADEMHNVLDGIYDNEVADLANDFLQHFYNEDFNTEKHREKLATASGQLFLATHHMKKAVNAMNNFHTIMCIEEIQRYYANKTTCNKMKRIVECPYKDFLKIYNEDLEFYENAMKKQKKNDKKEDAVVP